MRVVICIIGMFAVIMTAACDNEKDDFSGLSDLVAQRNQARDIISKESKNKSSESGKKNVGVLSEDEFEQALEEKEVFTVALYKKNIEILDSLSGETLAQGVAFIDKQGRIVKIKITKE